MDFVLNPGIAILGFNLSNEKDCCEAIQGIEIVQLVTVLAKISIYVLIFNKQDSII